MSEPVLDDPDWRGKRVLVAGGTAGLGLVVARQLARRRARLAIVGRSSEGVRRGMEQILVDHPQSAVEGISADLASPGEADRVAASATHALGGLDAVVHCVGRSGRAKLLSTSASTIEQYVHDNLFAAVEVTRATAEAISESRGAMIYVGSLAGKLSAPFMGPYCVAKRALAAYVEGVRLELAATGVRVLLVSTGPIQRLDAGERYDDDVTREGLPAEAARPGGGASLRPIDPIVLAERLLAASAAGRPELVMPRSAAILAGLIEWFPSLGRRMLIRRLSSGREMSRNSPRAGDTPPGTR